MPPGRKNADAEEGQLFLPSVFVPPIVTRQPDGSVLVRAGKPVILSGADEIGTLEAAEICGLSQNRILALIDEGKLREGYDWRRNGKTGVYFLKRESILRFAGKIQ